MKHYPENMIDQELIIKYFDGELNEEEQNEFDNWLKTGNQNAEYLRKMELSWNGSRSAAEFAAINTEESLKKVKQKIADNTKTKKLLFIRSIAAIMLVLITAGSILYFSSKELGLSTKKMLTAKTGSKSVEIELPDGTIVTLNKNSELKYPGEFDDNNRQVELFGEAFFKVAKNTEKPFRIEAMGSITRVLGTQFNVKALKNESRVIVTVAEGKVVFSKKNAENENVHLTSGLQGIFNKTENKVMKQENNDANYIAWKTGKLIFDKMPLPVAIKKIEEQYDVRLKTSGKQADTLTLNATFDNLTLEDVLKTIELTLDIRIIKL